MVAIARWLNRTSTPVPQDARTRNNSSLGVSQICDYPTYVATHLKCATRLQSWMQSSRSRSQHGSCRLRLLIVQLACYIRAAQQLPASDSSGATSCCSRLLYSRVAERVCLPDKGAARHDSDQHSWTEQGSRNGVLRYTDSRCSDR